MTRLHRTEAQMLADPRHGERQNGAPDLPAALHYIRSRQTPEGGFSYYRDWGIEEPAAADTYYAVAALTALGAGSERDGDCVRWLRDQQDEHGGYAGIGMAWYVTEALACLSAEPRHSASDWLAPYSERLFDGADNRGEAHEFLLDLLRYVELRARLATALESRHRSAIEANLKRLRDASGAFTRDAANLVDSALALRLMRATGLLADRRLLEFALVCQDSVCGFRAVAAGQSTSLEVLAAGVAIMQTFKLVPEYPHALLAMVAACQHASGGFGRHIGAVATLRDTYLAVYVMNNIKI